VIYLYTDGAARGNPGPAGAGAWACDDDDQVLFEHGSRLGRATNNEAEYRALILGLQSLRKYGYSSGPLTVSMDSELIIRQLQGAYRVKSASLRPLFEEARSLLRNYDPCVLRALPRADNARADALANAALDARTNAAPTTPDGRPLVRSAEYVAACAEAGDPAKLSAAISRHRHVLDTFEAAVRTPDSTTHGG